MPSERELLEALRSDRPTDARRAGVGLAALPELSNEALEALAHTAATAAPKVASQAARVLEARGKVKLLARGLAHPDEWVRLEVAGSLAKRGSTAGLETLEAALKSTDADQPPFAVGALEDIRDDARLSVVLTDRTMPADAREAAASALGRIGGARAASALSEVGRDGDRRVAAAARRALAEMPE